MCGSGVANKLQAQYLPMLCGLVLFLVWVFFFFLLSGSVISPREVSCGKLDEAKQNSWKQQNHLKCVCLI